LPVKIEGPTGSLILHRNGSKPAVFLAGGIGITPFRSMAREAAAQKLPHQIYLFYSNRRPEDSAYLNELQELAKQNPRFHLFATMTGMEKSAAAWSGETGMLTMDKLRTHLPAVNGPIYYVAGPPAMVAAMRQLLIAGGLDEDDLRTEDFAGY
jgi:ferredoxin-NADP reductase